MRIIMRFFLLDGCKTIVDKRLSALRIRKGSIVDCRDRFGTWYLSEIFSAGQQSLGVHFLNRDNFFDHETIERKQFRKRVAPPRTHTSGPAISDFAIVHDPEEVDMTVETKR